MCKIGCIRQQSGLHAGIWSAINVLDAAYGQGDSEFQPRTLSIVVQDKSGVLNEVSQSYMMLNIDQPRHQQHTPETDVWPCQPQLIW